MIIALACNSILAIREEWRNGNAAATATNAPGEVQVGHLVPSSPLPPPTAAPSAPAGSTTNGVGVHDVCGGKNFDMISP